MVRAGEVEVQEEGEAREAMKINKKIESIPNSFLSGCVERDQENNSVEELKKV